MIRIENPKIRQKQNNKNEDEDEDKDKDKGRKENTSPKEIKAQANQG